MANRGPTYGLSRELEEKNAARFDLNEAQETLEWISQVTRHTFTPLPQYLCTQEDVAAVLKDGVQLCALFERIAGRATIEYHTNARMPFLMMENISNFLRCCKEYGVPEWSCFQTVDLYECKQLYKVFECIRALAGVAQKRQAPIPIPHWVVRVNDRNERRFPTETMIAGAMQFSLQYGSNKGASQKGMTPYGLPRQIMPEHMPNANTLAQQPLMVERF